MRPVPDPLKPCTAPGAAVDSQTGSDPAPAARRPAAGRAEANAPVALPIPIPDYLQETYWWAYVHPKAVRVFERRWLVNAILLGNYRRLCDACLSALGPTVLGETLQLACVYGDLTPRLLQRLGPRAHLDVIDVLPVQLDNLARKLPADRRVALRQGDASRLDSADARYDQVLLFFLLHELPDPVRRATLAEALRVVKPGGRIVLVDYHRPAPWHPLGPLLRLVFGWLEPYAMGLWTHRIEAYFPSARPPASVCKSYHFGRLYQCVVITR